MLDLDYGSLQLVLPHWRIEGASDPLSIKIFPGWLSVVSFPFWIITVSVNIILYISLSHVISSWYWYNILIFVFFAFQFRKRLCDNHETVYLLLIKNFVSIIHLKLTKNFEYVLYRAKLAAHELERLKIDVSNVKKILIILEDNKFYNHRGIDLKALFRGFLSNFKYFRNKKGYLPSGGSTLTMQLARTLFIQAEDYNKLFRRKIIEILLAKWLDRQLNKDLILGIYLSSVRFGDGVFGIASASKYWFNGPLKKSFTNEEAFFLVERLSSPSLFYNRNKIEAWAVRTQKIIPELNLEKLFTLYEMIIK
jgi:penicillin-binding protein 1A